MMSNLPATKPDYRPGNDFPRVHGQPAGAGRTPEGVSA